jgi:hypothetical protein
MTISTSTFSNVNVGSAPNDGTGDPLRTSFTKINENFQYITDTIWPNVQQLELTANLTSDYISRFNLILAATVESNFLGNSNAAVTANTVVTKAITNNVQYNTYSLITGATGNVEHNFANSSIFYHSNIAANFTVNVTNLNLSSLSTTSLVLVLNQGATPYLANGFSISGDAQTIKWQNSTVPTTTANNTDVISFSLLRQGNTYTVLGTLTNFG